MDWNAAEVRLIAPVLASLESDSAPRRVGRTKGLVTISPSEDDGSSQLCPGPRSAIVRQLCDGMQFSESRLCQMRLEHKLVQSLVLHHYCGSAMPATRGLQRELLSMPAEAARDYLETAYPRTHVIVKSALGNSSGERRQPDKRQECLSTFALNEMSEPTTLHDEAFVLQERVDIEQEFRLHTVEDQVVPELTFRRYGTGISQPERDRANAFGQHVLNQLPSAVVRGMVAAWDVAATKDGRFVIIEANLAGYHTVFEPGYHCSGYFLGSWAATSVAKLMDFVEQAYDTTVRVECSSTPTNKTTEPYWRVARWLELYRIGRHVDALAATVLRHPAGDVVSGDTRDPEHHAFAALLSRLETVADSLRMT